MTRGIYFCDSASQRNLTPSTFQRPVEPISPQLVAGEISLKPNKFLIRPTSLTTCQVWSCF